MFEKFHDAKATMGGEYGKAGHYYIIIENVKKGKHAMKGTEFVAFEARYLHVIDKAIWSGDPKACPFGLNLPGTEPKVGEPVNQVFMDGVLGNENRLKALVLKALDLSEEDYKKAIPTQEASIQFLNDLVNPATQFLKNCVVEIKAGPQKTRSQKDIIGSKPLNRIYADKLQAMKEVGQLEQATVDFLTQENRLVAMLAQEATEKKNRGQQTTAGAAK